MSFLELCDVPRITQNVKTRIRPFPVAEYRKLLADSRKMEGAMMRS